jgi:hypothetical protein
MDLADVARNLRVPTLILCGTADVLTVATLQRLAALTPGSRIHLAIGAGHMLPLEAPKRVDREIVEFVESVVGKNVRRAVAAKPESGVATVLRRILAGVGFGRWGRLDEKRITRRATKT